MSQIPAVHDVVFWSAAGVKLDVKQPMLANTTYYGEVGGEDTMWDSVQYKHDDAIVLTGVTIESSNLPQVAPDDPTAAGALDFWGGTRTWETATGNWKPETAIATYSYAGGGATTTYTTELVHIGGGGQKRRRVKVVVGATGGKFRCIPHRKD